MCEVLDLEIQETPEVKAIKHILRNDPIIAEAVRASLKTDEALKVINIKIESDFKGNLGLGGSAGYSLCLGAGIQIGMMHALGLINSDNFEEKAKSDF